MLTATQTNLWATEEKTCSCTVCKCLGSKSFTSLRFNINFKKKVKHFICVEQKTCASTRKIFLLTLYANVTFSWWIGDGWCHWASVAKATYPSLERSMCAYVLWQWQYACCLKAVTVYVCTQVNVCMWMSARHQQAAVIECGNNLCVCAYRGDPPVPWRRLWWSAAREAGRTRYTSAPRGYHSGPSHTSTHGRPAPAPSHSAGKRKEGGADHEECGEGHVIVRNQILPESIFQTLLHFSA